MSHRDKERKTERKSETYGEGVKPRESEKEKDGDTVAEIKTKKRRGGHKR